MTIFDSIRYPISDIPTTEQLEALPPRLYYRWVDSQGRFVQNPTPEQLAAFFQQNPFAAAAEVKILRAMILDYDDDLPRY